MASEFEKNVQRAMEGLRVRPSGEIWERVEEEIRENKRKRRILFFVIFSLIGLSLAGYGIFKSGRSNLKSEDANINTKNSLKDVTKATPTREKPNRNIEIPFFTEAVKKHTGVSSSGASQTSTANRRMIKKADRLKVEARPFEATNSTSEISAKQKTQAEVDTTEIAISKSLSLNNDQLTQSDSQSKMVISADSSIIAQRSDDSALRKDLEKLASAKKPRMRNQAKWEWGINISLGASTITQDAFSFKGTSYSDALAYSAPGTVSGGGSTSGVFYGPSGNKAAFAFKAGFQIKNEISERGSMSVGLRYAYLADKIKVGQSGAYTQFSGSRSSYYAATPQNTYTEHFHFIELPLSYDWRMTKNSNRYFSLTGGMSGSYLVSTNALVYDTAQHGIYYQDNSLFSRMHVNLMAGTAYHVSTTRTEFAIGPQFSFDLTKLIDSDVDKRKYFLYIGLDTRIFFEKEKRK
jgi:hypothetical protein